MDEKTLKALIDAGAIQKINIIAEGSTIYVEADSGKRVVSAKTVKGKLKTWSTLDAAARWVRSLGMGRAQLDIAKWQPGQKRMKI